MEHKSAVPVASKQSQSEDASKCQVRRGEDTENAKNGKRKKTKYRHRKPKKGAFVDRPNDTDCKCRLCNVANCTVCHQKILLHVQAPAGSGHILVVLTLMQWDSLCVKFVRTNNDFRLLGHN